MKQVFIPAGLLTKEQMQELIKKAQDAALDAWSKKSGISKEAGVVRQINPQTDINAAGTGQIPGMRLGDGAVLTQLVGWRVVAVAPVLAGVFVELVPEFTVPDDRAIVIVGLADLGGEFGGALDPTPVVQAIRLLTGGNAIIDQWNAEELEKWFDTESGPDGYAQTVFPYIDEDQLRVQLSLKRAMAVGDWVNIPLKAFVVEKYGKVISKKEA